MAAIVLFCLALLVCIVLGTNILYALLAGLVIFTLYGKKQGFSTNGHTRNWGFPQNPQASHTQTPLVSYRNND